MQMQVNRLLLNNLKLNRSLLESHELFSDWMDQDPQTFLHSFLKYLDSFLVYSEENSELHIFQHLRLMVHTLVLCIDYLMLRQLLWSDFLCCCKESCLRWM